MNASQEFDSEREDDAFNKRVNHQLKKHCSEIMEQLDVDSVIVFVTKTLVDDRDYTNWHSQGSHFASRGVIERWRNRNKYSDR